MTDFNAAVTSRDIYLHHKLWHNFSIFSPVKSVIFLMFSLPVKFVVFSLVFAFLFLFLLCYFSVFCFSCVISLFFVSLVWFLHKKKLGFISCVFPSSIFVLQATYSTLLIRQWSQMHSYHKTEKLSLFKIGLHHFTLSYGATQI